MSEHPDCLSPLCDCMDGCVVQAVAATARAAALEEAAAKVLHMYPHGKVTNAIAAAIRELKDK